MDDDDDDEIGRVMGQVLHYRAARSSSSEPVWGVVGMLHGRRGCGLGSYDSCMCIELDALASSLLNVRGILYVSST